MQETCLFHFVVEQDKAWEGVTSARIPDPRRWHRRAQVRFGPDPSPTLASAPGPAIRAESMALSSSKDTLVPLHG